MAINRNHDYSASRWSAGSGLNTGINKSKILQDLRQVERRRVELPTSALRMCEHPIASDSSKALTPTPPAACTSACTSAGKNTNADGPNHIPLDTSPQAADAPDTGHQGQCKGIDQGRGSSTADQTDPLAKLADALLTLSPADRELLAAMLKGYRGQPPA
jgi:hypothetical protein